MTCRDNSGYFEAGNAFRIHREEDVPALIERLKAEAEAELVPGTRYEIRRGIPWGIPERTDIAWYWTRKMSRGTDQAWLAAQPGPRDGYILVENCITS